ncbi:MAG: hypothetical protein ACR2IE_05315 [Candidatus Sumerlaeaceae bacterium]
MNITTFEAAWNTQPHGRITIDMDILVNEVRQNDAQFRATIFWRDAREIIIALLIVPIFWYMGQRLHKPWTWYLVIPAVLWIASFMLVDRFLRKGKRAQPGADFRAFVISSLAEVRHQVWLLRNVAWWYLMPIALAFTIDTIPGLWARTQLDSARVVGSLLGLAVVYAVFAGIWWLNQYVVRKDLEPRASQLKKLLAELES